jgi:hypothetical protein
MTKPRRTTQRAGCLFVVLWVVIASFLLVANAVVVSFVLGLILPLCPDSWSQPRNVQAFLFLGPIALLVIQWWSYDVLTDWILPLRRGPKGN